MDLPPTLTAILAGFFSGFVASVPVGPVNLTIMNEGARRGFRWAALIGLGATVMEVLYCVLAFTSFAAFFQNNKIKAAMQVFSFAFMLFLGMKFLMAKSVPKLDRLEESIERRIEGGIEKRFHPTSAFMTGFVRTLANPGVLLFWIVAGAYFISHRWVEPNHSGKFLCIAGVAGGVGLWFFGLAWGAALGHGRFTEKTMRRLEIGSGIGLLVLGVIHGINLALQLAKTRGLG
ncbi:MAG TPA: LysE family transporter [Verrucomicrobiae bacterium]|nr:LysE family transporter [Verrucomicrobiae bacterium]